MDDPQKLGMIRFTKSHEAFADHLLQSSDRLPGQEVGYPRCENLNELYAEYDLYDEPVENALFLILSGPTPVGIVGALIDNSSGIILWGPIAEPSFYSYPFVCDAMKLLLAQINRSDLRVRMYISARNSLLASFAKEYGMVYQKSYYELCFDIAKTDLQDQWRIQNEKWSGDRLHGPLKDEIFGLFSSVFDWREPERLDDLIEDGCMFMCSRNSQGTLVGVVAYCLVKQTHFARIEYISVEPCSRRQGIATYLLKDALLDIILQYPAVQKVYLSLTSENHHARALYDKLIFTFEHEYHEYLMTNA